MASVRIAALLLGATACVSACKNKVEDAVRKSLADGSSAEFEYVEQCSGDSNIYYGRVKAMDQRGPSTGTQSFFYGAGEVAFADSPSFTRLMKWCYDDASVARNDETDKIANVPADTPIQGMLK